MNQPDQIEQKIESLGYRLPEVPTPLASYVNCVRTGNLLFLSGGLPFEGETKFQGKFPDDLSVEEGYAAARLTILNRLAVIKAEVGSLDRVVKIVNLNGFVASAPDFYDHPKVINGASDFLVEVFGDKGKHSRNAFGVAALPLNACCEINLVVEIA